MAGAARGWHDRPAVEYNLGMAPLAHPSPQRMRAILRRLVRAYGPRPWRRWGPAVDLVVDTILSQNTNAANSDAGYRRLRRRFRSWNQVADVEVGQVEQCIRVSGLSRLKAPRIQGILRQIRQEHGRIDLEFLKDLPPSEAREYLLRFKGIGPKTARCVLLFAFGMPVFPVDTHIHRIALRLGLTPPRTSAERAHDLLAPAIAPADRYAMHILLIDHGRRTCRAINPACADCVLLNLCPFGQARQAARPPLSGDARPLRPILRPARRGRRP